MPVNQQNCDIGITNTGQSCVEIFGVQNRFIAVSKYNSLGVLNEIDLTAPLDSAFWTAAINDLDPTERFFPLWEMKNISDLRADPNFKDWDDGSKSFVNQGIRTVMGIMIGTIGSAPPMEGKLNALRGNNVAFYAVDKQGNLLGKRGSTSTKLAPIEAESDTIYAVMQKTIDGDVRQIKFGYDVATSEQDSQMWMVKAADIGVNLNDLRGLIDVTPEYSNITATTLTVKLVTDGGDALNPVLVKGLVTADFVSADGGATSRIYNATDDSDVTVTVVESPAGSYTLTFLAQTAGDILVIKPLKNGFDFTAVEADTSTAV